MGGLPPRASLYHEMREANLLVMLGMLAGHAGDVENDADDVDGRVKYVHFARKCCKLQHFSSRTENKNPKVNKNPKLNLDPSGTCNGPACKELW